MAKSNAIIIKRIKKGHAAHHGGAWKVAYADFVTAMMAFFLLLWLLNATTDKQKRGIADYFAPTLATQSTVSGAAGVMGGKTMMQPGSEASDSAPPSISQGTPTVPTNPDSDDNDNFGPGSSQGASDQSGTDDSNAGATQNTKGSYAAGTMTGGSTAKMTDAQFRKETAAREAKEFAQAQQQLQQAIQNVPELRALAKNLIVDQTQEGLRIQIVDLDQVEMFALGSTAPSEAAKRLLSLVEQAILRLPNRLAITGHTDSTPYAGIGGYSNWELSADRANAARRLLVADGLPIERIATVDGRADTQNLIKDAPTDPRNRRISITVLRTVPQALGGNEPNGADGNQARPPSTTASGPPPASSITVTNSFGAAMPISTVDAPAVP